MPGSWVEVPEEDEDPMPLPQRPVVSREEDFVGIYKEGE